MISFANPLLLWFFPVLILPWIFRRKQQERIQKVNFALLRFLKESEEKELINPHLQELLLLILRTLLLAVLILGLAGPKWFSNGQQRSGIFSYLPFGRAFESKIMVLDTSYSMGYSSGNDSWWNRTQETWNQLNSSIHSLAKDQVRWDQSTVSSGTLNPLSNNELTEIFAASPSNPGTPVLELFSAIQQQYTGNEGVVIVTDGQRWPWKELLDSSTVSVSIPPSLVITIGQGEINNSWCEVETLSSPPWGISGWETIAGHVYSVRSSAETGSIAIRRRETGENLYSKPISFPESQKEPAALPFLFSALYSDLSVQANRNTKTETNLPTSTNQLVFSIHVKPDDDLSLDNSLTLEVPCIDQFTFGIASNPQQPPPELSVLEAAINPLAEDSSSPPIIYKYLEPGSMNYSETIDLAIISNRLAPWWSPAESSLTLEYIKNGGSVIIFSGGTNQSSNAWNSFLEELGWIWHQTEEPDTVQGISITGKSPLDLALDNWDTNMWRTWIPASHGKIEDKRGRPLISYDIGEMNSYLISEMPLGIGRIWLVNSALEVETQTLLSPVFPAFLWETAKEVARHQQNYTLPELPDRNESNLTLLTQEDKKILQDRYGIRFANPEKMNKAVDQVFGRIDLRMFLLFLCLLFALAESWLSNNLASR